MNLAKSNSITIVITILFSILVGVILLSMPKQVRADANDAADSYCAALVGLSPIDRYAECVGRYIPIYNGENCDGVIAIPDRYQECLLEVDSQYKGLYVNELPAGGDGADPVDNELKGLTGASKVSDCEAEGLFTVGFTEDGENDPICVAIDVGADRNASNPIIGYLTGIVDFVAAGVGLIIAAMMTVGGVEYMYSRGNPSKVESAKKRIANALIALGLYIFMFALLQWIIPGGII